MIVSKNSLEAAKMASIDKSIPVLNNLCIKPDGTVIAANGKSIVFVSPVPNEVCAKFPIKTDSVIIDDIIMPLETVSEISKSIPKDTMFKGMLEHADISETGTENELLIKTTDGKRHKEMRCKSFGRKFMDINTVLIDIVTDNCLGKVAVNLKRFLSVVETLTRICPDGTNEVPLFIEFYEKATILRTFNMGTGQRSIAVIFNYRPDNVWWMDETEWEKTMLKRTISDTNIAGTNKKSFKK